MKMRVLAYALVAVGLLCGSTFHAAAQAGPGRGAILSQEDRTAVQEAVRDDMTKLRTDLQAAQKAAVEAALSGASEADLKAKLEAVAKVQTQMALVYNKAVLKVAKLTDEQKAQMKENPMMGYMTLFGGGFGGFGGGRGGGRRAAPGQ